MEFKGIPKDSKRGFGLKCGLPKQKAEIPRNSKEFQKIPKGSLD